MAQMGDTKKSSGCGALALYSGIFRRRKFWRRRSSSTSSLQRSIPDPTIKPKPFSSPGPHTALVLSSPPVARARINYKPSSPANQTQNHLIVPSPPKAKPRTGPTLGNGLSGELDSMLYDHQRSKGSSTLVRATSGNVMMFGNLGNLRGNSNFQGSSPKGNLNLINYLPKTAEEEVVVLPGKKLDAEEMKKMGNEAYKKGKFGDALVLYERAIEIDSGNAAYWSNKAAALMGLGRILEAVDGCKEAIRIESSYSRAHHRLGTLHLRLGEADKAVAHYKLSGNEASPIDISQAQTLQAIINKCNEARKLGDWNAVLREAKSAVSARADSAPQVFAWQAEALLKLDRHDEAEMVMSRAPKFDLDASAKFFGTARSVYALMIRAEVEMAAGRFDDAVRVAQMAAQLDPGNREMSNVLRRSRVVALARSKGNDLFKVSKFVEACNAYQEGLNHVPRNAVFLCNRAASRSKLGQWERAVEDCNAALLVRPSYTKARLRRADCNAKLERWEASVRDYEVLASEIPGDGEVSRALLEAQEELKKQSVKDGRDAPQT